MLKVRAGAGRTTHPGHTAQNTLLCTLYMCVCVCVRISSRSVCQSVGQAHCEQAVQGLTYRAVRMSFYPGLEQKHRAPPTAQYTSLCTPHWLDTSRTAPVPAVCEWGSAQGYRPEVSQGGGRWAQHTGGPELGLGCQRQTGPAVCARTRAHVRACVCTCVHTCMRVLCVCARARVWLCASKLSSCSH